MYLSSSLPVSVNVYLKRGYVNNIHKLELFSMPGGGDTHL